MSNVSGTALADSILAKAAQPGVLAISFDVFDTLLVRPVYEPVDAFDIASSTAADVLFPGKYSFRDIRVVSERLARADSHSYGVIAEDISIYKIYDCIQKLTGISDEIID